MTDGGDARSDVAHHGDVAGHGGVRPKPTDLAVPKEITKITKMKKGLCYYNVYSGGPPPPPSLPPKAAAAASSKITPAIIA